MAGFFDDNAPPADWVDPGWTPQPAGGGAPTPIELGGIPGYTPPPQDYFPPGTTPSNPGGGYTPPDPPPYVAPQSAPTGGTLQTSSPLAGWDADKWNDPNHNSPKYVVGRILAKYPPTTAGLQQAWGEIQSAFPSATFDGKDSISGIPGTMGAVDVLAGASQGGTGWWWGDQGAAGADGGGGAAGGVGGAPAGGFAGRYGSYTDSPDPFTSATWTGGDYQQLAKTGDLNTPYRLPTQAELEASPGYMARLAAGLQARDRSAAAKGTVLNGGTQMALARYGQDYASNEYSNLVGQTLGARQQNYGEYSADDANAFRNYQSRYGQFQDANNNSRTDYALNVNTNRNAMNDQWAHLNDLYQTGAQSANGSYKPGVQS